MVKTNNKLESPETQLTRGGLLTFWVKVTAVILGFAVQLLVARLLGKAGYGDYSFAITTFNFLVIAAVAGSDAVATRFVAVYRASTGKTTRFLTWLNRRAVCYSLALLIGSTIAVQVTKQFDNRMIWTITQVVLIALPLQVFALIRQGILRGRKRPVLSVIPEEVIRPLGTLLFVLIVFFSGNFFWGDFSSFHAAGIFVIVTVITFGIGHLMVKGELMPDSESGCKGAGPENPEKEEIGDSSLHEQRQEWRSTTFAMMFSAMALTIHSQCDIWMLGIFTRSELVGPYVAAVKYSSFVIFGINAINTALGPMVASSAGDTAKLQKLASRAAMISLALSGAIAVLLLVFPGILLNLFGTGFDEASWQMRILVAGNLFNVACGSVGMLLTMTGHHKVFRNILVTSMLLNVLLNGLLIPFYQTTGAAVATTVSVIVWNVMAVIYVRKNLKIKPTIGGLV